jgi:hypothetical protein
VARPRGIEGSGMAGPSNTQAPVPASQDHVARFLIQIRADMAHLVPHIIGGNETAKQELRGILAKKDKSPFALKVAAMIRRTLNG